MGRQLQYTTLDRIISKIYRDLGLEEISETDLVEWCGEALEAIGAITLYEEAVAFAEISNHHADLPNGMHAIIQVARDNYWSKEEACLCPANIILDTDSITPQTDTSCSTCSDAVPTDCNGNLISTPDLAYYRPYFDLQYEYNGWANSNMYRAHYSPVRLANHVYFNTLVCTEDKNFYDQHCHNGDEYTLVHNKLRTSFKEGYVAIAYYRQMLDEETGYPLIPDEYSIITAITMYITMKYMGRLWYLGREGYGDKMQKAEQDWQWYCKQAGNKQMMVYGIEGHEKLKNNKYQMIPQNNRYYGFFGKLGTPANNTYLGTGYRFRGI